MTRDRRDRISPQWWFLAAFGALALIAALTADGQTARTLPPECSRWQPPAVYPSAPVSAEARAKMQTNTGPWTATRPPEGLAPSYPTLLAVFEATWNLSSGAASRYYDATPESPQVANAAEAIRETVRPPWVGLCCDEYQSQVAFGAFPTLYGVQPTFGQETLLMARKRRTGGGANSAWWPDSAIYNAARCLAFVERPMVFPTTPPNGNEIFWAAVLRSHKEVGLALRDAAGNVVTEASIRCHFDPECDGGDPTPPPAPVPPPPPPELPDCTPFEGSACEAQCDAGRERFGKTWTREWCLSPDRDQARGIGAKCASVCRGGEPPPEPEPEPEEPAEPELECWEGRVTGKFRPGVPSTGRLEVELFRVDCPPSEGGGS